MHQCVADKGTLVNDLDDLRAFVAVVENGGLNRAAERLGMSKSIVSRRIARLEDDFGARLLSRTTRGVTPTEAGLELKGRSERILAELEEAREAVAQQSGEVIGRLRVSAPLSFVNFIAPILGDMACRHPKLELDVSFSDRSVDLVGEKFDAAIRVGNLRDPNLIARRLAEVQAMVVASPAYIERRGAPETPHDLLKHSCIIYSGAAVPELRFRKGKDIIAVRPEGRLRADNGDAQVAWAVHGLGIAVLPAFFLIQPLEDGKLVRLLRDYALPELGIYVVRPPGAYLPGKVRVLIDTLVEHFERFPIPDSCKLPEGAS